MDYLFLSKFPSISKYFEEVPREHIWSQHRQGLYNGLFYVPAQPNVNRQNFRIPQVLFGNVNINQHFRTTAHYKLIKQFKSIYKKIHIDDANHVHIMSDEHDFTKDTEVQDAGTLFGITHLIYNLTSKM